MTDLIERIEAAQSPCRELDARIEVEKRRLDAYAAGLSDKTRAQWRWMRNGGVFDTHTEYSAPKYTGDISAALTLVPDDFDVSIFIRRGTLESACHLESSCELWAGHSATPALAICAAAIRARNEGGAG